MDVAGSRILVTGGSRGIGAATARAFAAAGGRLALVARSADALEELASELGGTAHAVDLADGAAVAGLVERIEADGGPVDVLVNNAGVENGRLHERTDEAEIESVVAVNLVAALRLTRQVLPGMIRRGRGHIVNVSSAAAAFPAPGIAVYCATKAGLSHFTATLRGELAGTPVGTTTCTLGPVDTSMWDRVTGNPNFDRSQRRLRRLGLITDVSAEAVADDIVEAVRRNRRHVRHPKRLTLSYGLGELNRRTTELLLTGVRIQR